MEPLVLHPATDAAVGAEHVAPKPRPIRHPLRQFTINMAPTTWMCVDWLIIGIVSAAAYSFLVYGTSEYGWIANPWLVCGAFCISVTFSGLVFGLYERETLHVRSRILVRTVLTLSLGVVLAFACLTVFFYAHASRWVGLAVACGYLATALPLRLYAHEVISTSRMRLLCVGTNESVRKLVDLLDRRRHRHHDVVGHVRVNHGPMRLVAGSVQLHRKPRFRSEEELEFNEQCPCLGTIDDIAALVDTWRVDDVVVASELAADPAVAQAVGVCLEKHRRVTDQATFVEKLMGEIPVESISADWFLRADIQSRGNYEAASRVVDVCVAVLGLALTLPFWPVVALIVRLDSRGPALFKQLRVGKHGRLFTICKFRTMREDAEKDGAQWAAENDNRITRVGQFLRKSRIDELPQLLNILRGDMSLVGPRPERPEFVRNLEQLIPHYRLRHLSRPGLTGWAQIQYRYGASVADAHRKLCYDLYYLKHRSLEFDLAILIRTFGTFLLGAR